MDAKEAREIANSYNKDDSQYFEIINIISEEAKKGNYEFYYGGVVKRFVVTRLLEQGFNVNQESHRNETTTKISW